MQKKTSKMSVVSTIVLEGNQQIKAKKATRAMRSSISKVFDGSEVITSVPDESEAVEGEQLAVPDEYILPDHVRNLFKPYRGDLFSSSMDLGPCHLQHSFSRHMMLPS